MFKKAGLVKLHVIVFNVPVFDLIVCTFQLLYSFGHSDFRCHCLVGRCNLSFVAYQIINTFSLLISCFYLVEITADYDSKEIEVKQVFIILLFHLNLFLSACRVNILASILIQVHDS